MDGVSFYSDIKPEEVPNNLIEITALFKQRRKKIRGSLTKIVNDEFDNNNDNEKQDELREIINYALLSGETYYRSFLTEILGAELGVEIGQRRFVAMLLEMMKTQIIMQENLPYMDNKDFSHKNVSCHKKYGVIKTTIAINSINSLIFHQLSSNKEVNISQEDRCKMIEIFTKHSGKDGETGRQMMKISLKKKENIFKDVAVRVRKMKIMTLFLAGAECLQVLAKVNDKKFKFIKSYVNNVCDILEMIEDCLYGEGKFDDLNAISKAESFAKQASGYVKFFADDGKLLKDFTKLLIFNLKYVINSKKETFESKESVSNDNYCFNSGKEDGLIEAKIS